MALITANTQIGPVRGIPGERNPEVSVFRGIPFAVPPVGELRFCPPQPTRPWSEERLCNTFSPACIQTVKPGMDKLSDSEDCLCLNIYTPAKTSEEKLPVLFWLHGGAFSNGSASEAEFNGEHLCSLGAVVVTANYRCGALGFFTLPGWTDRGGNLGLLDQLAALRWVHDNIAAFGGDPGRVTVFGQSAGGMSTRMLLTSPLTAGLMQRAIIESGGGLNEGDLVRSREDFTQMCQNAMEHLGWAEQDVLTRPAEEVANALHTAARERSPSFEVAFFQPFVDGVVLTDVPGKLIAAGQYLDIPIICGTVAGDSWMFSRKVRAQLEDNENYFRAFSYAASEAWAQQQTRTGRTPIFTYYFDRKQPAGGGGFHMTNGKPPFGAATPHSSEIAYVFGTLDTRKGTYTDYDQALSDVMSRFWVNFATSGNPNSEKLPLWTEYTAEAPLAMHFGDESFQAERLVRSDEEQRIIDLTIAHPGMLERL